MRLTSGYRRIPVKKIGIVICELVISVLLLFVLVCVVVSVSSPSKSVLDTFFDLLLLRPAAQEEGAKEKKMKPEIKDASTNTEKIEMKDASTNTESPKPEAKTTAEKKSMSNNSEFKVRGRGTTRTS